MVSTLGFQVSDASLSPVLAHFHRALPASNQIYEVDTLIICQAFFNMPDIISC